MSNPTDRGPGKHRIIDRARAKLPLRMKLAPGEKIDVQSIEGPALFVRTNKRLLFIRADDSIVAVTGALKSTYLTGKGYWHRWTYHPRQQVLSAIQMWAPMLHLWRLPSGGLLTARPSKLTLDTWLARQRVKWDVDNPADGKARRRTWLRSGERGEAAPDGRLAVVEHPPMHYALVLVRPNRLLITLPRGLGLRSYFTPRGRYLHTAHIDSTECLWRIPGWRSSR